MDHLAIMKKSWGLTEKILSGEKKIESRWYLKKRDPWDNIKKGETVYFKDSGYPVTVKARVSKVLQFGDLNPKKVRALLERYRSEDGIEKDKAHYFYGKFKTKRYCMLIFLRNPKKVKPFYINKKGFGNMASWISVGNIKQIKILN
jgi:ASC-1-like (ASCH) protein